MIKQGYIKKKGDHGFNSRYLVLNKDTLQYYVNQGDAKPKGCFPLSPFTRISSITSEVVKRRKVFLFTVSHRYDTYQHYFYSPTLESNENFGRRGLLANTGKITALTLGGALIGGMTAGLGLLAGAMIIGAGAIASGGGALSNNILSANAPDPNMLINNASSNLTSLNYTVTFCCDSFEEAEDWIRQLQIQVEKLAEKINVPSILLKRKQWKQSLGDSPHFSSPYFTKDRLAEIERWLQRTEWRVSGVHEGIRLLSPVFPSSISSVSSLISSCQRVNLPIQANINDTFLTLLSFPASLKTGVIKCCEIIEQVDACCDIVYIQFHPLYLSSFMWTKPRDFCLLRYWKKVNNHSYLLCLDSTIHDSCPEHPDFVRGDLHLIYTISSANKKGEEPVPLSGSVGHASSSSASASNSTGVAASNDSDNLGYTQESCLVSVISLMDPRGWVWTSEYINLFQRNFLMHILDLRDTLEIENFFPVYFENSQGAVTQQGGEDDEYGVGDESDENLEENDENLIEKSEQEKKLEVFRNEPPATMPVTMFREARIDGFKVRGPSYHLDGLKIQSTPEPMFPFLTMDLYETKEPIFCAAQLKINRVALARKRADGLKYFVFNLIVPGPPYLCFVSYYLMDPAFHSSSQAASGSPGSAPASAANSPSLSTPFGRVASLFFSSSCSSAERNNRFKIIPKILEGNFLVKAAVKDTPALIGNKLTQTYHEGENFFEIDVDVGSSAVAKNLCGLAMGYCKTIVLDMGLCLQGNDEDELPEAILGGVSFVRVDATKGTKVTPAMRERDT